MSRDPAAHTHLSAELLEELTQGGHATAELLEQGLSHLASRCSVCRGVLASYPGSSLAPADRPHPALLERAKERVADLARERTEAPQRVAELLAIHHLPGALAALAANPRYQTWGVATHLQQRGTAALEDAPLAASACSMLATAAAHQLAGDHYGRGIVATAQSLAGALVASTRVQVYRDLSNAAHALARADALSVDASDRPLIAAELALTRMRLHLATGDREAATRAFGKVESEASRGGLEAQRLRALLLLGRAHRVAGDLHRALATFRVLAHVSGTRPAHHPIRRWGSLQAASTLCDLRRPEEALAVLSSPEAIPAPPNDGRARGFGEWTRGRALAALGRSEEAEAALERAWSALAQAGAAAEATAALLDLAHVALVEKGPAAADGVLDRAPVLYRAESFPRPATGPLYRLQVAAARHALDPTDIATLRRRLLGPAREAASPDDSIH